MATETKKSPEQIMDEKRLQEVKKTPMQRVYQGMPQDPFFEVPREEGWHYCRVDEHDPRLKLPSNLYKFKAMGYEIAHQIEGTDMYLMRIPEATFRERKNAALDLARARRGHIKEEAKKGGLNHFIQDNSSRTQAEIQSLNG